EAAGPPGPCHRRDRQESATQPRVVAPRAAFQPSTRLACCPLALRLIIRQDPGREPARQPRSPNGGSAAACTQWFTPVPVRAAPALRPAILSGIPPREPLLLQPILHSAKGKDSRGPAAYALALCRRGAEGRTPKAAPMCYTTLVERP